MKWIKIRMEFFKKQNSLLLLLLFGLVNSSRMSAEAKQTFKENSFIVGEKSSDKIEFRLGVVAPNKIDFSLAPMSLNSTLVALQLSIEKLLSDLLPDFYFNISYLDTDCDYKKNSMAAVIMYTEYNIDAFFGPMCTTLLPWTSALSAHYELNSMTAGCHSTSVDNKASVRLMSPFMYDRPPTNPTSDTPTLDQQPDVNYPDFYYAVNKTFDHYGWKMDIAAVYRNDHSSRKRDDLNLATIWSFVSVWKGVAKTGVESYQVGLPKMTTDKDGMERLAPLDDQYLSFSTWTRVLVVGLSPEYLRQFLYGVFVEKEFKIEEYIIVYLDNNYMIGNNVPDKPWLDPNRDESDPYNQRLKHIFRHVLVFRVEDLFAGDTGKYEALQTDFTAACEASVFKNCSLPRNPSYLQYVAATYDGIKLLMQSMNNSLDEAKAKGNKYRHLFPYVQRKQFHDTKFAASPNVTFNFAGQRINRMTVLRMESVDTGVFTVHTKYNLDGTNETVGPGVPWIAGGVAPKNPPDCGYSNEFCQQPDTLKYLVTFVSIGVSILMIIILIVGFLVYRKVKMEEELMKMVWKIKTDELDFTEWKSSLSPSSGPMDMKDPSASAAAGGSSETLVSSAGGPLFAKNLLNHHSNALFSNSSAASGNNNSNLHASSASVSSSTTAGGGGGSGRLSIIVPTRKSSSVFAVRRISHHQGPLGSTKSATLGSIAYGDNSSPGYPRPEPRYVFPRYRKYKVAARPLKDSIQFELNRKRLIELKNLKSLSHEHIVRFIGCAIDSQAKFIVYENCAKGSLYQFLRSPMKADLSFRFSLMLDIARGLHFLVQNGMFHGRLNAKTCVLDNRFVCKIGDHGLYSLRTPSLLELGRPDMGVDDKYYVKYLYMAPEILRREGLPTSAEMQHTEFDHLMQRADYYSFAIISHEILYQKQPFHITNRDYTHRQKLMEIIKGGKSPFRPMFDDRDFTEELESYEKDAKDSMTARLNNARMVMEQCWSEQPHERPDLNWVIGRLKENVPENIMENMLQRMDKYAKTMETLVEEKAKHVVLQKKRADDLLYSILPVAIANKLIKNEKVSSEWFDEATIYFSDIVGFTALSSSSTPEQVVDLLNHLYTLFDSIIDEFDVYKVETIGDAYMVVSGIPIRNGSTHSYNIAAMSLKLLEAVKHNFVIPHRPNEKLKLRIGLHTGPACAGVVGVKMPRYCLFGDTVNTASRMESNGEPLKIHISEQCRSSLLTFNEFLMEYRGEIEMKGKGLQKTYWLKGRKSQLVAKNPKLASLIGGNEDFGPTGRRSVCLPSSNAQALETTMENSKIHESSNENVSQQGPKISTCSSPLSPDCSPLDDSVFDSQSPQKELTTPHSTIPTPNPPSPTSHGGDNNNRRGSGLSNGVKGLFSYNNKGKLKRQISSDGGGGDTAVPAAANGEEDGEMTTQNHRLGASNGSTASGDSRGSQVIEYQSDPAPAHSSHEQLKETSLKSSKGTLSFSEAQTGGNSQC